MNDFWIYSTVLISVTASRLWAQLPKTLGICSIEIALTLCIHGEMHVISSLHRQIVCKGVNVLRSP